MVIDLQIFSAQEMLTFSSRENSYIHHYHLLTDDSSSCKLPNCTQLTKTNGIRTSSLRNSYMSTALEKFL